MTSSLLASSEGVDATAFAFSFFTYQLRFPFGSKGFIASAFAVSFFADSLRFYVGSETGSVLGQGDPFSVLPSFSFSDNPLAFLVLASQRQ